MRRYIRSYRTRRNVRQTNALRDQFIRQLTREAEGLLKQLTQQFSQELEAKASQALQGIVPGATPAGPATDSSVGSIGGIAQLLSTGVRYLVSRPRTRRDTQETTRSIDSQQFFKLSRSQTSLEAQAALGKGDKNA